MSKNNKPHPYLIAIFIFICGFLAGVGVTVYKMQPTQEQIAKQTQQSSPAPGFDHKALHQLEDKVKEFPDDGQMWKALSEMYFDSNQIVKAIPAYERTIELIPNDANIITDLGVMYRRNQEPNKAIAAFKKAISIDPKHEPARFNIGIVTLYDLKDKPAAIIAFEDLLSVNPEARSGNGGKISEFVEHLKSEEEKK